MTEKPYGEIMDEMDHEAKYLPAEDILQDITVTMRHARVFITSREKMHPTGVKLYDELLAKLVLASQPSPAAAVETDERCPTCSRTDYEDAHVRMRCRDPWHADAHLRATSSGRPKDRR